MNLPKALTSPLAATAGVVVGMALLAIPLRQLTSAAPMPAPRVSADPLESGVPAWLTLKLLAPAKSVSLKTTTGKVLWDLKDLPAGDVETQAVIPLDHGGLDVTLSVALDHHPEETAVFLTIAPDGLEEETRHAIGGGSIEEPMNFTWPAR